MEENRLNSEVAKLQSELDAMEKEKQRLQDEVAQMSARKDESKNDAQDTLEGLKTQIDALQTDINTYTAEKTTAQTNHDQSKRNMIKEHGSEEEVLTKNINDLQKRIDELQSVHESLFSGTHDLHTEFAEAKAKLENTIDTHTETIESSTRMLNSIADSMAEIDEDKVEADAAFE